MAYATQTNRAFQGATSDRGLNGLWSNLNGWLAWRRNFRETRDELSMLSDRELADLGIHRSQIGDVAREAADRS